MLKDSIKQVRRYYQKEDKKIRQTKEKTNNKDEYDKINKAVRNKCIKVKENWLNDQCNNIEINAIKDTKTVHKGN